LQSTSGSSSLVNEEWHYIEGMIFPLPLPRVL
jgi:hypothetical protein